MTLPLTGFQVKMLVHLVGSREDFYCCNSSYFTIIWQSEYMMPMCTSLIYKLLGLGYSLVKLFFFNKLTLIFI